MHGPLIFHLCSFLLNLPIFDLSADFYIKFADKMEELGHRDPYQWHTISDTDLTTKIGMQSGDLIKWSNEYRRERCRKR